MFIAALFTMAWKQQVICWWMNAWKIWYKHARRCNPALKRNRLLQHATIWMSFKVIILNEINQSQKDKLCMTVLM